ncbi:MAG: SpoIIE family protein phosphatase [Nitrospinae bacterium]|nr:SpoIIE family protein phosphatase [Nitrospinota bacterium]
MSDELSFLDEDDTPEEKQDGERWKVLVVDDEEEILEVTRMALGDFSFKGKGLELYCASTSNQAKKYLEEHSNIILVLLDIVMEEDDTGLNMVKHIRNDLNNFEVRIVLRTGQPGYAPEREVIVEYDINDYKEKHELTAQKLFTTVVSAIRSYSDLMEMKKITSDKERLNSELNIAREIQFSVMPSNFPLFPERNEFDVLAHIKPANEVGGDFYDIFLIDENKVCIFVGDVSGKGIGAAMFMMTCKTLLRRELKEHKDPAIALKQVNQFLFEEKTNVFATIFVAILDFDTNELLFSNAAHNPPLLISKDNNVEFMEIPPGYPLTMFYESEYSNMKSSFNKGDYLFIYTDGVTEAMNPKGDLYSETRLKETMVNLNKASLNILHEGLLHEVSLFSNTAKQSDDITILSLKVN